MGQVGRIVQRSGGESSFVIPHLPSDQESSGRSFGSEELQLLRSVIESGTLTATKGSMVRALEERFARHLGVDRVVAAASGTAAVHAAVAAVDPEPGDEIVTSPVTDMGAIAPILYQSAIPVFADVDVRTGNITADTVAQCLSDRTRAVIVTHLFGNPAPIREIVAVAGARGIPVIEDCAQAYLATVDGRPVGTFGAIAAFSLQQGKHITTGEGGLVATDDAHFGRRLRLFVDKAWPYGEPGPDHEFLALNGRLSELQGAVALAQLEKLDDGVAARRHAAELLTKRISSWDGVEGPDIAPGADHSYWRYCLRVDPARVEGGPDALARALGEDGIASAPRYIQKPAFRCAVIADQRTFGDSRFPFTLARPEALDYSAERFPGTFGFLDAALVLPWNERYRETDIARIGDALEKALARATGATS
jgi:perosamine synthetase